MKQVRQFRIIIYVLSILTALTIPFFAWYFGAKMIWPFFIGTAVFFIMVVLMDRLHQSYMDRLLIELSDLIDSIIIMRENEIFSDVEDTLLSKLQNQVLKLSGILKAQNKAINKEKDEIKSLISDISHQIKTPVASIKMFGELLQEPDLREEQRIEYLQVLEESLNKLAFLTDSMIKMSRLESGIIRLRPQSANINDIILQAVKQIYPKAKNKDIEILFDTDKDIALSIDKNWTAEAVFNILDNAVKYTPAGGAVTITVNRYESFIRIDIADNGIGISEEEQAKIWGRFYRGQGTGSEDGIGIGLYLSRKIIVDQGGYIKVKSDGNGSVFSVFLYTRME